MEVRLGELREAMQLLEEEGFHVRSDVQGFLQARSDLSDDVMVQVGLHSVALAPSVISVGES